MLELGTAYCTTCAALSQVMGEQEGIEGVAITAGERHHERTVMLSCGHTARIVTP